MKRNLLFLMFFLAMGVCLIPATAKANLLLNPSLEDASDGALYASVWITNWNGIVGQ